MRIFRIPMNEQKAAEDGTGGSGASNKPEPDPRDAALEAARAAKKKSDDDFAAYKASVEREKMTAEQKLVADNKELKDRAEKSEARARLAELGTELVAQGLRSIKFVSTVLAEREGDEDMKSLAARLKAQDEFSGLFGTAAESKREPSRNGPPAPAPKVPGSSGGTGKAPTVIDEDEDARAFAAAFPKDPNARALAKTKLAEIRQKANNPKKNRK